MFVQLNIKSKRKKWGFINKSPAATKSETLKKAFTTQSSKDYVIDRH